MWSYQNSVITLNGFNRQAFCVSPSITLREDILLKTVQPLKPLCNKPEQNLKEIQLPRDTKVLLYSSKKVRVIGLYQNMTILQKKAVALEYFNNFKTLLVIGNRLLQHYTY